jgi:hypothetical protein
VRWQNFVSGFVRLLMIGTSVYQVQAAAHRLVYSKAFRPTADRSERMAAKTYRSIKNSKVEKNNMKSLFRSSYLVFALSLIILLAVSALIFAQQKKTDDAASCPMMKNMANMSHDDCPMMKNMNGSNRMNHDEMVMENGEKEMGFSQTATTHHFIIAKDGGAIRVTANEANDITNRDKIREHLKMIAEQFKNGIFTTPFAVHGQVPPGVPKMDKLKAEITYSYAETETGAEVRITTRNADALNAIREFLKFQITEHKTGDSLTGDGTE